MLEKLRQRLATIAARLKELQDAATTGDGRAFTAEEQAEIDKLTSEHGTTKAQVERLERIEAVSAYNAQSRGRQTQPTNIRVGNDRITGDPMRGFRDAADYALAVRSACQPGGGQRDARLVKMMEADGQPMNAPSGYQTEGSGADGGFLVPPQIRQEIMELVLGGSDLLSLFTLEPTSSNVVELSADESTPWGASGVKAKWRNEGEQMTSTGKSQTEPRMVKVHELYAFALATDELLADAPRLANRITNQAARAINWKASDAIMWGDGVGKPLGFMRAASLVTVAKESGQAAASLTLPNLLKMLSRFYSMGGRPTWFANSDIIPALYSLTLGQNGLMMLPQEGATAGLRGMFMNIPIQFMEHCKSLGTVGDLVLADPNGYYGVMRQGITFADSIHLFFDYNMRAFRWTFRMGGQPFLSTAISPANGSATKSPFVALADRA